MYRPTYNVYLLGACSTGSQCYSRPVVVVIINSGQVNRSHAVHYSVSDNIVISRSIAATINDLISEQSAETCSVSF